MFSPSWCGDSSLSRSENEKGNQNGREITPEINQFIPHSATQENGYEKHPIISRTPSFPPKKERNNEQKEGTGEMIFSVTQATWERGGKKQKKFAIKTVYDEKRWIKRNGK